MSRTGRILIVLAGIMGADGVMLAAASAHGADASRLASASSMLLFHASAVLGAIALAERGIVLGTKCGLDSIRLKAEELGVELPEAVVPEVLAAVKPGRTVRGRIVTAAAFRVLVLPMPPSTGAVNERCAPC